jgi:Zn-dependent M28 family amino/carboxypeptidase
VILAPRPLLLAVALVIGCSGAPQEEAADTAVTARRAAPMFIPLPVRLERHLDSLSNAGTHRSRAALTEGNRWAVEYIDRALRSAAVETRLERIDGAALDNVVAEIRGRSDSVLVIGAHLDASASRERGWRRRWRTMPAPGAVDNATGIAALIEIARALRALGTPRYTVELVAYNAEEFSPHYRGHHLGSRHHVARLRNAGRPLKGAIVLDMVSANRAYRRIELFATPRSRALAREIGATHAFLRSPLELAVSGSSCSRSDNESFDRIGLPAVLLMESCAPWRTSARHPRFAAYHSTRDTPEQVNLRVLEDVVQLVTTYAVGR